MKHIIYSLSLLLLLLGCGKSDEVNYEELSVGFLKNKIDVGENSELLEIPVALSGCKTDIPLNISVKVSSIDRTAKMGIDYELLDKQLVFNASGVSTIRVRIINNAEITTVIKDFVVELSVETAGVQTGLSSARVYIISDDVEKPVLTGFYTLTAQGYTDGVKYSTAAGGVEIIQDEVNPEHYIMRNLVFINGTKLLPLTKADELYFVMNVDGGLSMPVMQNIGNYGQGDGFTVALMKNGETSGTPIEIVRSGKRLIFAGAGFAGISVDEAEKLSIYYAFKNMILEKK